MTGFGTESGSPPADDVSQSFDYGLVSVGSIASWGNDLSLYALVANRYAP